MINENISDLKIEEDLQIRKEMCAVVVDGDEILLVKDKKLVACNLFEFPKREILLKDNEVYHIFKEMKGKYGIKGKTKDEFICNIQHSYRDFDLMMYVFVIYASKDEIKFSDELSDIEWFNINQIWKVPLAPVDVTVAQILLEFNED
jgi:hypothetical protein